MALPAHVEWLRVHRGDALSRLLAHQGYPLDASQALQVLVDVDPSPGAHAVQWLCTALLAGGYLWEDVASGAGSKVGQTLAWFSQYRAGLPRGSRNLEDYDSVAAVYAAIAPMLPLEEPGASNLPAGRAARRLARQQAYRDSIIVHRSADMLVAVPLTRQASCWWGRGTRWCTAGESSNMFDAYNKVAPLIVVVLRGNAVGPAQGGVSKLQLHIDPADDATFMDETDARVSPQFIEQHWAQLEPVMAWAMGSGARMEKYIPHELWRGRIAQMLVAWGSQYLEYIPWGERTHEICMSAVSGHGMSIVNVPEHMRDMDICRAAVKSDGRALELVSDELRTAELCLQAVQSNGNAIAYVPQELYSPELFMAAVTTNGSSLLQMPRPIDFEVCLAAITQDYTVLPYVVMQDFNPEQLSQLYAAAVAGDGSMLRYVPDSFRTPAICVLAVKSHLSAIRLMMPEQVTPDVLETLASTPRGIRFIPSHSLTPSLCTRAVGVDSSAYPDVPYDMRDGNISRMAVLGDGRNLQYVPATLVTPQLCTLAVQSHPFALPHVPEHMRTDSMLASAVMADANVIRHLMDTVLPEHLYMHALKSSSWNFENIPESRLTNDLCAYASSLNANIFIRFIPDRFKSLDFYKSVCIRNKGMLPFVPQEFKDDVWDAVNALPASGPTPDMIVTRQWVPEQALAGLDQYLDGCVHATLDTSKGNQDQDTLVQCGPNT